MTQLFIVNKLTTSLVLKGGFIDLPAAGFAPINEVDRNEQTIVYAVGRDWAYITETQPVAAEVAKDVPVEVVEPYKGMTEEELKASKAEETAKPDAATGTALGADTTVEVKTEEVKEAKTKGKGK